ncbi:hypothetical protein [Treponema sp.]|uniref:hypothetical protein n=1 Tax=Treponema sp. TaxID=166 RepID=UPI0038902835
MLTDKLCAILSALGGNPSALPDMLDITIIDAIIAQINTSAAVTAAEVLTAIQAMTSEQKSSVKTAIPVTAADVSAAITAMDAEQIGAVKTALGISE